MSRTERIQQKLSHTLTPEYLLVENESHQHRTPKGAETHFKIVVVSQKFVALSRLERQRLIHAIIAEELNTGLHALSMSLHTPSEWQSSSGSVLPSPPCQHKNK